MLNISFGRKTFFKVFKHFKGTMLKGSIYLNNAITYYFTLGYTSGSCPPMTLYALGWITWETLVSITYMLYRSNNIHSKLTLKYGHIVFYGVCMLYCHLLTLIWVHYFKGTIAQTFGVGKYLSVIWASVKIIMWG